jgi:uncharacterized heparinase superfamily protein
VQAAVSPKLRTLLDMGPRRLQRRLRYEVRQHLDRALPQPMALAWAGAWADVPPWRADALAPLASAGLAPPPAAALPPCIRFSFLNDPRDLPWPIGWNQADWPRLWQFHLHYFDWARDWLEQALGAHRWPELASLLEPLIDHWIAANRPAHGDGWHSYTTSLRIRNWIWLFRCCPALATPERLASLWRQLCWLQSHPEHCHGGNHWLENLSALAIGGLQFDGPRARALERRALTRLQQELPRQILADGGHEERSASYHLLMLDRLVELGCVLQAQQDERPPWLLEAISAMGIWAMAVRLADGSAPRFNDSAADAAPPLDQVVAFAQAYLHGQALAGGDLRALLTQAAARPAALRSQADALAAPAPLIDLPATGWTLLRPGGGWELCFKCGQPCPPHLPAHAHSDQLSLDLFWQGEPLLIEAGTSVYGNGPDRAYERSGAAHNLLQLGHAQPHQGEPRWIEPVEVWHGFRAGRKARPRQRDRGVLALNSWFVAGSHDGYDHHGASHHRRVEVTLQDDAVLHLVVIDALSVSQVMALRLWWHLAPSWSERHWPSPQITTSSEGALHWCWHDTWMSLGFGQRLPRRSLCVQTELPPGRHQLISRFAFQAPGGR